MTGFPKEKFLLIGTRQFSRFVNESTSDQIESELRQMEEKSFSSHLWGHRQVHTQQRKVRKKEGPTFPRGWQKINSLLTGR